MLKLKEMVHVKKPWMGENQAPVPRSLGSDSETLCKGHLYSRLVDTYALNVCYLDSGRVILDSRNSNGSISSYFLACPQGSCYVAGGLKQEPRYPEKLSIMSNDQTTQKLDRILAASFKWCRDTACQFSQDSHLLVHTSYIPLETGNAVAISYTWGEFGRRDVVIGHDDRGRKVVVNLGQEWDQTDFINKIYSMGFELTSADAETPMPFWMDQLCIPQDNEVVIRQTIACIPQIFYTLDAVALLPGHPCKCLRESLEEYGTHTLSNQTQGELDQLSMIWAEKLGLCVNSISFCSYFERVWTRQEMLYSRHMRVHWTSVEESPCVLPSAGGRNIVFGVFDINHGDVNPDEIEDAAKKAEPNLAPFARQVYQRALSTKIAHAHALAKVKMSHDKAWHNTVLAFEDFRSKNTPRTHGRYHAIDLLCRFLLREPLELIHDEPNDATMSDAWRLKKFTSRLSGVGWVQRRATRPRDYVLAVWISCPKYVIPKDYTDMSLPDLLEDAILQLERNFNVTVPVTTFAGLFGNPRPSILWRPSCHIIQGDVTNTQHVYGPVISECPLLPLSSSEGLSLNIYGSGSIGRSQTMMKFDDFAGGHPANQVFDLVKHIVMGWSNATMERIESARKFDFAEPVDGFRAGVKANLTINHPVMAQIIATEIQQALGVETILTQATIALISADFDHFYTILFDLVCDALGLSVKSTHFKSTLSLVVDVCEYPAIGLLRKGQADLREITTGDDKDPMDRVTVCRDIIGYGSGHTILEISRSNAKSETFAEYEAVGVWVPRQFTPWEQVAGVVTNERLQNARLI